MKRILVATVLCLFVLAPASARAQESNASFGLGAESMLTGPTGIALVYDMSRFRIDGLLAFDSAGADTFFVGGRFFWVMHQAEAADLSLGGGLGLLHQDRPGDDDSDIHLELSAQIRMFLVSNVALTASLGAGVVMADNDEMVFSGQSFGAQLAGPALAGGVGLVYFFQ